MRTRPFIVAFIMFFMALPAAAQEATIVQPFAGSQYRGQYAVEFDRLTYIDSLSDGTATTGTIEGQLRVGIARWPEGKSQLEVQRNFENALTAAGFTIFVSAPISRNDLPEPVWDEVNDANKSARSYTPPAGTERGVGVTDLQRIYVTPQYYISARRSRGGQETVFALTLGDANFYMMEEATSGEMSSDGVTVSAEELSSEIEETGKAILYGVQFDTGSAVIRPSSAASLESIADVLMSREGSFYIVGHTDDTGGYEMNMQLSADRAASIEQALIDQYGIDGARLISGGVGPLAPLASNENEAGRQLNRRVELVEQLPQ